MSQIFRGGERDGHRGGHFRGRGRGPNRGRGRGRGRGPSHQERKTLIPEKPKQCAVCHVDDHKYRCPQCSVLYCSLKCFKDHKVKCLSDDLDIENEPEEERRGPALSAPHPALPQLAAHERRLAIKRGEAREEGEIELFSSDSEDEEEDDEDPLHDGNPDRLTRKQLQHLASSSELKQLLANPHLRNLVLEVDGAEDKNAIMQAAMQEPLFLELADVCLVAVGKDAAQKS